MSQLCTMRLQNQVLEWKEFILNIQISYQVLYMSFDRFILAVESRDLSQAGKSIIRVSSFPKLSDG